MEIKTMWFSPALYFTVKKNVASALYQRDEFAQQLVSLVS